MAKEPAVTLRPIRGAMMETKQKFQILLHGQVKGELYFNMRGYLGTIPTPSGGINPPEGSLASYKREIARANREWAGVA